MFLILILAACASAASTPEVVEPTLAPTPTPEVVVEPTQAPSNTPEPTAIPTTPTEEPPAEPEVFISSGVKPEDLADKLSIYEVLQENQETLGQFLADTTLVGGLFFDFTGGSQPLTIFAPVYKYEDFPSGTFPSEDQYKEALTYHVVPGLYLETDLAALNGQSIPTRLEGQVINIAVKDGKVYLNDVAMVIRADILALNGVIHVIDVFLMPPGN